MHIGGCINLRAMDKYYSLVLRKTIARQLTCLTQSQFAPQSLTYSHIAMVNNGGACAFYLKKKNG